MTSIISENIKNIRHNIEIAAQKSGRNPKDITLIGVTKTVDSIRIQEMIDCGVYHLGENRVQELIDKYPSLNNEHLTWHLIGHLQTNKVKYIMDKVALIHSVDNLKLAEEIQKKATSIDKQQDILIEVNIADEESKWGLSVNNVFKFVQDVSRFPNLSVKGLMTVAPFVEDVEENRKYFKKMFQLFIDIKKKMLIMYICSFYQWV